MVYGTFRFGTSGVCRRAFCHSLSLIINDEDRQELYHKSTRVTQVGINLEYGAGALGIVQTEQVCAKVALERVLDERQSANISPLRR